MKHLKLVKHAGLVSAALLVCSAHANSNPFLQAAEQQSAPTNSGRNDWVASLRKNSGKVNPEKNIFFELLSDNDHKRALFQWWSAFSESEVKSNSNLAVAEAILLIQNDMPATAIDQLFSRPVASAVDPKMVQQLKTSLQPHHELLQGMRFDPDAAWGPVVGPDLAVYFEAKRWVNGGGGDGEFRRWMSQIAKDHPMQTYLAYRMALGLEGAGQSQGAEGVLREIVKQNSKGDANRSGAVITSDLVNLTLGRMAFAQGRLKESDGFYRSVSTTSEHWFQAQEERAWISLRSGRADQALGILEGLNQPGLTPFVGPETYMLQGFAELKTCSYERVFDGLKTYSKHFKNRYATLEKLSNEVSQKTLNELIARSESPVRTIADWGKIGNDVPRSLSTDLRFTRTVHYLGKLRAEERKLKDFYHASMSEGTAKIGFEARFGFWQKASKAAVADQERYLARIISSRAGVEMKEIQDITRRMHLLEAEALQQVVLATEVASAKSNLNLSDRVVANATPDDAQTLKFQFEGERWFDEIGKHNVDLKKICRSKEAHAR